jgi:hypothetical protein
MYLFPSKTLTIIAFLTYLVSHNSVAALITFDDEISWQTAIAGSLITLEDFESFDADEDFSFSTSTSPNGFSITHNGVTDFRNLIDTVDLDFTDGNGTNSLSLFVNFDGVDTLDIVFDSPLKAFAFDSSSAFGLEGVQVEVFDSLVSSLGSLNLTNDIDDFVGFLTNGADTISSLRFSAVNLRSGSSGEGFRIDNVQMVTSEVPAPGPIGLLAFVLLAFRATLKR